VLTSAQLAAISAGTLRPVWFVQMDLDVVQRWSSANTTLNWNGFPWVPLGQVASISEIDETAELEIKSIQLGISGVPVEVIALVEAEPIQGRLCQVWLALYDDNYALVDTPILEYKGRVDVPANKESAIDNNGIIKCDLSITVENRWAFGLRPKILRRTDADQKKLYPNDTSYRWPAIVAQRNQNWWGR
jgi:hypothetical protein